MDAVIDSGRAVSETALAFGISWWLVQHVIGDAALRLLDVDLLAPRMLGTDEHRYRSVRFFQDLGRKVWTRYAPWMTTIVDLDTGQVLGIVDGRDHKGVGNWLFARPLQWRFGVQVVAIDPSAAFRKALRMWLPRTAVSVDLFHVTMLAHDMLTTVRQGFSQQVRGRRGRATDPAWANRMLLLKADENLSERARTGWPPCSPPMIPPAVSKRPGQAKKQLRTLLNISSLEDAGAAKNALADLVTRAAMPERNRLYRTVSRWWAEIKVLIVTGATTAKVEANNTAIKHIKRTARGYRNPDNYKSRILLRSAARMAA